MDRKLTIITPTYNRGKLLPHLYDSLTKQNCTSFLWMVVDDGSADNTGELVQRWQQEGKLAIVYRLKSWNTTEKILRYSL